MVLHYRIHIKGKKEKIRSCKAIKYEKFGSNSVLFESEDVKSKI